MKILVLNYEYPPLGGGAGVITQHISEGFARLGNKVTVVTTWFDNLPETEEQGNLKIIRLKSKRKFIYRSNVFEMLSWLKFSKKFLNTYCCNHDFDFCFANFSIPGGEVGLFLKNRFNIPYVVISHGHDIPWMFSQEMFFYHLIIFYRIKQICRNSKFNVMLNTEMKKNADKFLGMKSSDKNIIIPNGCDFEYFMPANARKTSCFRILFTGRLVKQKTPFVFLKALKLLSGKGIEYKAKIIGDGILRRGMEKFVDDNFLSDTVEFTGWVPKETIRQEYQSTHVFVQTSRYEAMSVATLEALACGTYVFCTPVGANKDIIVDKENGEFFSVGNAEELAEKLYCFHNEKFKTGFVVNNSFIEKVSSAYNWDIIVSKYMGIIKQMAFK